MSAEDSKDVSELLVAWSNGDDVALGSLMSFLYPELRGIARRHLRARAPGDTLESAALANEAYLKLMRAGGVRCEKCVLRLAHALEGNEGIEAANANLMGQVSLAWDDERTSRDAIVERLTKSGFPELAAV